MIHPTFGNNQDRTEEALREQSSYHVGYQAYCDFQPLANLTDPQARRGWLAALRDDAYASTSAYLIQKAEDEERHQEFLDQEWIRRGQF